MHPRSVSMTMMALVFLFVISVAARVTASQQASTPGANPQAPPAAQSPPSQSSPSPQNPSGASGTNSSGAQSSSSPQAGGNNGHSIDQELQLTEDQKQKIAAIVQDENRQIESVRADNTLNLEQKQQKVLEIRQAGSPKIKALLSPEQLQKLIAIQQRMREQRGQQNATPAKPQR